MVNIKTLYIFLLIMLTVLHAGISSKIIGPLRVSDIILIIMLGISLYKSNFLINVNSMKITTLLSLLIICCTVLGLLKGNNFILSDIRIFFLLSISIIAAFASYRFLDERALKVIFYSSTLIVLLMFIISGFIPNLHNYYIDEFAFEQMAIEGQTRAVGPAAQALIVYIYIMATTNQKKLSAIDAYYLFFAVALFALSGSRETLLIMLGVFLIKHLKIERKNITTILLVALATAVTSYILYLTNDRFNALFDPMSNTSLGYRFLSNSLFAEKYLHDDLITILFGYGFGAQIQLHLGSQLGVINFSILDNGPLTVLLKSGLIGAIIYIIVIKILTSKLHWRKQLILIYPILMSSLLSSHIATNFTYILGLSLAANYIKSKDKTLCK